MSIQALQREVEDTKKWLDKAERVYKRDLRKRIELINWVLEEIKNPGTQICAIIETRMNELIDKINQMDSILEADPLDNELRILDWILYIVCSNEIKRV